MNCDVPALWVEHKEALRGYIRKRVPDEDLAADILQDVLLKVYSFCQVRSGVANVRAWLFQIAHNALVDAVRRNRQLVRMGEEFEVAAEEEHEAYHAAAEYIMPLLGLLPPAYAEPLRLSDVEGLKQQDVATQLGLGLSAAKSRIQRGRVLLKDLFVECCLLETDAQGRLLGVDIRPGCRTLEDYRAGQQKSQA